MSEALLGPARLELETSNTSGYTGFNGALKIYIGRNCVSNPSKGYICDYKYQMAVSGLQGGRIYEFDFPDQVDSRSDQILMTYRDQKEAMFSGMKLKVTPPGGGAAEIVDLKKLDGSTSNVSVFDYDSRDKPCGSSYPRNAVCRTDTMFDLYTGKEKPHYRQGYNNIIFTIRSRESLDQTLCESLKVSCPDTLSNSPTTKIPSQCHMMPPHMPILNFISKQVEVSLLPLMAN